MTIVFVGIDLAKNVFAVRGVSEVIGGLPQIAPKKHCVPRLWQGGMRCRGRPV